MATEEAPQEAQDNLVKTILRQNSAELKKVITNIGTKDFYKVVNARLPYFVEVGMENDTMLIDYWPVEETATVPFPVIFNKLQLELDKGRRWFMFTVEDVKKINEKLGNIGVLASPKEAPKEATLHNLTQLKNNMRRLRGIMSSITPSKDTYNNLVRFREELSTTVTIMDSLNYPNEIKAYVDSAMGWVVKALVDATTHKELNAIERIDKILSQKRQLMTIRSIVDNFGRDGYNTRLDDEQRAIYDNFQNPNSKLSSDQDIDDEVNLLNKIMITARSEKDHLKGVLDAYSRDKLIAPPQTLSVALTDVNNKIEAIGESSNFNPTGLDARINRLITILNPNEPSTGGRMRTNKKRSTRRKKKRGKRRRSYRTKR